MNPLTPRISKPSPAATAVVSVVVPVFNEEAVLPAFHHRLAAALAALGDTWEIVYVDDGSSDATPRLLKELHAAESCAHFARLSRNFGKEAAMRPGLSLRAAGPWS